MPTVIGSSGLTVGRAVDWQFAATVGARLARPAPPCTEYTRGQVIDQLTAAVHAARQPVCEVTGLDIGAAMPPTRVVDRPAWIHAGAQSMRVMTGGTDQPQSLWTGRVTGAQAGVVLAFVASGIIGQYDPFDPAAGGSLLLVYPNVIAVERQLHVNPADFRLWVCLHEVTHLVQFTAHPWLADYMLAALATLTQESSDDVLQVAGRLAAFLRGGQSEPTGNPPGILGVLRAVQSEPQQAALDQLFLLGTLLEGHADHVMDAVGPTVVPSVATIRSRFDDRRHRRQPPLQRLVRALLGIDAKLSQYTRGKAFVDQVVDRVGMQRFNTIWTGPATLPLPREIENPQRWIDRVL
ncbi:MAG: zinc-dependent metalloprotease [Mycobacteriaceae bacterium]|nr:zinc-dependent metalloprotease [Mycobacteriaceae bacterium]